MITGNFPNLRLRRSRKYGWSRRLIEENSLSSSDLILPIFIQEGKNKQQNIKTMPGVYRYSIDKLEIIINKAIKKKIPVVALFPSVSKKLKDKFGNEALNGENLVCLAVQYIKKKYKNEIGIMCDVALDPYTNHGHDGIIKSNYVLNDETVDILIKQSLLQAEMGCDIISPSDMMDGRIGKIIGAWPTDLKTIYPWHNYEECRLHRQIHRSDMICGHHGIEGRYPLTDQRLFQSFLNTTVELKNRGYKNRQVQYMKEHDYPITLNKTRFTS